MFLKKVMAEKTDYSTDNEKFETLARVEEE